MCTQSPTQFAVRVLWNHFKIRLRLYDSNAHVKRDIIYATSIILSSNAFDLSFAIPLSSSVNRWFSYASQVQNSPSACATNAHTTQNPFIMTSVYFLLCADPTSVNYLNSFLISFSSNFLEFIYLGKASLLRRTHAFNCLEFPCLSQGRWFKCSASARNAGIKPAILHFSRCNCSFQYYLLFNCYFYFWACSLIGAVS